MTLSLPLFLFKISSGYVWGGATAVWTMLLAVSLTSVISTAVWSVFRAVIRSCGMDSAKPHLPPAFLGNYKNTRHWYNYLQGFSRAGTKSPFCKSHVSFRSFYLCLKSNPKSRYASCESSPRRIKHFIWQNMQSNNKLINKHLKEFLNYLIQIILTA